jgi:hypothetical protein
MMTSYTLAPTHRTSDLCQSRSTRQRASQMFAGSQETSYERSGRPPNQRLKLTWLRLCLLRGPGLCHHA